MSIYTDGSALKSLEKVFVQRMTDCSLLMAHFALVVLLGNMFYSIMLTACLSLPLNPVHLSSYFKDM